MSDTITRQQSRAQARTMAFATVTERNPGADRRIRREAARELFRLAKREAKRNG
jgi:hypothetical protein